MATAINVLVFLLEFALLIWFGSSDSSGLWFRVQPQSRFTADFIFQTTYSVSEKHCTLRCLEHGDCRAAYYCGNTNTCALSCSEVPDGFLLSDPNCSYLEARNRTPSCLECGCKNGGTCVQITEGSSQCTCPVLHGGLYCELTCPPQFEVMYKRSCYSFNMTLTANFYQAKQHCESMGASLVAVNDEEEHNFIRQYLAADNARMGADWWTSATDEASEGTWVLSGWGDIPAPFTAWGPGEPNGGDGGDCVQYWKRLFDDTHCTYIKNFICETEAT
ncbi:C-type lectin domain family 10 member A-like [Lingula anatina]|uniref:C-type lectin domain family 10 member A-like n=1 Tax=Lingula anatina TaxID=7574 RepID=A0A1S3KHH8_LINAN|nr:C-type lectin domain family 10 member A-like [Lingula anatina]|eukprot:XP_013421962.1 C-type lectin domain family 10 member A-like [Lingula anatina]